MEEVTIIRQLLTTSKDIMLQKYFPIIEWQLEMTWVLQYYWTHWYMGYIRFCAKLVEYNKLWTMSTGLYYPGGFEDEAIADDRSICSKGKRSSKFQKIGMLVEDRSSNPLCFRKKSSPYITEAARVCKRTLGQSWEEVNLNLCA